MQVLCSQLYTPLRVLKKKKDRLYWTKTKVACYPLRVPGAVCLCLGGRNELSLSSHFQVSTPESESRQRQRHPNKQPRQLLKLRYVKVIRN